MQLPNSSDLEATLRVLGFLSKEGVEQVVVQATFPLVEKREAILTLVRSFNADAREGGTTALSLTADCWVQHNRAIALASELGTAAPLDPKYHADDALELMLRATRLLSALARETFAGSSESTDALVRFIQTTVLVDALTRGSVQDAFALLPPSLSKRLQSRLPAIMLAGAGAIPKIGTPFSLLSLAMEVVDTFKQSTDSTDSIRITQSAVALLHDLPFHLAFTTACESELLSELTAHRERAAKLERPVAALKSLTAIVDTCESVLQGSVIEGGEHDWGALGRDIDRLRDELDLE